MPQTGYSVGGMSLAFTCRKTFLFIHVFPILVLGLAELDELDQFIILHMDTRVDHSWIGEMFIYIIHGAVDSTQ